MKSVESDAPVAASRDEAVAVVNWRAVRAEIAREAAECGRAPDAAALMCVGKTYPAEDIAPLLRAGARLFGENRVQEAAGKWPALKLAFPDAALHLIGPLQTNKIDDALGLFDAIETLDRPRLAQALASRGASGVRLPDLFVQVNTGAEPQKSGILPEDADSFIRLCRDELALPVRGLMCIPPVEDQAAPHFALLAAIAARNGLERLSMGMTNDFRVAIQAGSTEVRIGSAIFGSRG